MYSETERKNMPHITVSDLESHTTELWSHKLHCYIVAAMVQHNRQAGQALYKHFQSQGRLKKKGLPLYAVTVPSLMIITSSSTVSKESLARDRQTDRQTDRQGLV